MNLDHLTTEQKLWGGATIIVVTLALFVYFRNQQATNTAANSGGSVSPTTDLSSLTSSLSSALGQLGAKSDAQGTALAGLIGSSAQSTAAAFDNQTAAFTSGLSGLGAIEKQIFGSIQSTQAAATNALLNNQNVQAGALADNIAGNTRFLFTNLSSLIQSLATAIQGGFQGLSSQQTALAEEQVKSTSALADLMSKLPGMSDYYLLLGAQSVASCATQYPDHSCYDEKRSFEIGLTDLPDNRNDRFYNAIDTYISDHYGTCKTSTGKYDLVCVGKIVAKDRGV
jgi:hypothetical protein